MGTIVLLLLLGWLAFTALLTIRAGHFARTTSSAPDGVQQITRISGAHDILPPTIATTMTSVPGIEIERTPTVKN